MRAFLRPQTPAHHRSSRLGLLALALAALLVAPAQLAAEPASGAVRQEQEDKKKRKKQRGKVVKATVVTAEPAPSEPTEESAVAETASEAAESEATESDAAAARDAKKAEKEARRQAKREEAERDRAERAAAKQREEDQRDADRERRREEAQAEQSAKAAAARESDEAREAARAAQRAESEAASEAAAEAEATESASRTPAPAATPAAAEPEPAAPAPAPAAEPTRTADLPIASADVSERIDVREVLLDVLVTDRKGNTIEGLEASDFEVTEDGRPVEVTSVVYYGGAAELQSAGIGETRTDRYFILLFHDQAQAAPFLRAAQMDNGRWAQKWIESELQPNDQVAVLGYDVRLKVYQDFSTDPVLLSQAVDAAVRGEREPDRWRTREADPGQDGSPSLLLNLPKGQALSRETRRLQTALELLGRASEGIVGRKNLLLFSAGFGDIDDIGVWTPDPRFYPPMKESLNTGNVAVYSIDLLGSRRGNPGARDINDALSALSTDTGGHYYSTFANVMAPLRNVAQDNLGYYLLSYRSEFERGTSGYREVKVKVSPDAASKKLRVRARKGFRFGT